MLKTATILGCSLYTVLTVLFTFGESVVLCHSCFSVIVVQLFVTLPFKFISDPICHFCRPGLLPVHVR